MSETMGQIIRKLRKERNLTQEELAEQLNITYQAVSRWENGTGMPDISQIVPLSNVFGVTTDVLFGININDADKEIENFIVQMETLICNRPENVSDLDHDLDWCNRVQEKLKTYPNHYQLLKYSIGCIRAVLDTYLCEENDGKGEDFSSEKRMWENELLQQTNIVLNHCTDASILDPPFGTKIVEKRSQILRQYDLGFEWYIDDVGTLKKSDTCLRYIYTSTPSNSGLSVSLYSYYHIMPRKTTGRAEDSRYSC